MVLVVANAASATTVAASVMTAPPPQTGRLLCYIDKPQQIDGCIAIALDGSLLTLLVSTDRYSLCNCPIDIDGDSNEYLIVFDPDMDRFDCCAVVDH